MLVLYFVNSVVLGRLVNHTCTTEGTLILIEYKNHQFEESSWFQLQR